MLKEHESTHAPPFQPFRSSAFRYFRMMEGHFKPCFSKKNWIARWLWGWVWLFICRPSPRRAHGWRRFWLRAFGAKIGRGTRVYGDVRIWAPWFFECGEFCILGDRVQIESMGPITLGNRVIVSQEAFITAGTHELETPEFELIVKPVVVEDRAWIAARAFVMPGVRIGQGSVVGAMAVVTRDVPAWAVVAGNPAKVIKERAWRG